MRKAPEGELGAFSMSNTSIAQWGELLGHVGEVYLDEWTDMGMVASSGIWRKGWTRRRRRRLCGPGRGLVEVCGVEDPEAAGVGWRFLNTPPPGVGGGGKFDRAGEEYFAGWCFLRAVGSVLFALLMQS
jgi:hypothetical protein